MLYKIKFKFKIGLHGRDAKTSSISLNWFDPYCELPLPDHFQYHLELWLEYVLYLQRVFVIVQSRHGIKGWVNWGNAPPPSNYRVAFQ